MNQPLSIEQQRQQFIKVINYLNSKNIKNSTIADTLSIEPDKLSKLCSGAIKSISSDIIEKLHKCLYVNPQFITHGASNMFDTLGLKYENFDKFIDSWDLVEHENNSYLHFYMDESFYNFLINVYTLKETSTKLDETNKIAEAFDLTLGSLKDKSSSLKGDKYLRFSSDAQLKRFVQSVFEQSEFSSVLDSKQLEKAFNKALEILKKDYTTNQNPKEYILIPVDTYFEIIESSNSRKKTLDELINPKDLSPIKPLHLKPLNNDKNENGTE